jgi:serine/threonine protein kinase
MTTSSEHTGTERYLSYELVTLRDEGKPTTASDVWALACVGLEVNIAIHTAQLGSLFF